MAQRAFIVERGSIRMAVPFQGEMEARRMSLISVGIQGAAVLTELKEEGTVVEKGEWVARLDSSAFEQDLVRHEYEYERAKQELESLEKAELPLELLDMQAQYMAAHSDWMAEQHFLEAAQDLMERGLMAEGEIEQQTAKVAGLLAKVEQIQKRMDLTKAHVHEARLAKSRAALAAAERQRDFARKQIDLCTMYAPESGILVHVPLPIGNEFRTARVGDLLYRNQVFLCIPDMSDYVVRGFIVEAELPWIQPEAAVEITPVALPHLRLTGVVESVGAMAQTRPGYPGRKFFPVLIALAHVPDGLPTGLSVQAQVITARKEDILKVPRDAVRWVDGQSVVTIQNAAGQFQTRHVQTGIADLTTIEIISGLTEGEVIWRP